MKAALSVVKANDRPLVIGAEGTDGALGFPLLMSNNALLSFGHEIVSPPWIPEVISVGIDFVFEESSLLDGSQD